MITLRFETKSDPPFTLRDNGLHHLSDGIKDDAKLFVVLLLKRCKFFCQFFMGSQHFAQPDEGPHNGNIYLYRTLAA